MTTLQEETALYAALAATSRVAVSVVGHSVEGNPIRCVRIGNPPPALTDRAAVLYVGLQHGNEPAGREGLIEFIKHLATTDGEDVRVQLGGSSGDYVSTPDTGALDITGDLDIRCDVTPDQWVTGSIWYLVGKYTTTGNQRSYTLRVSAAGVPTLAWSSNGTAILTAAATTTVPAVDGQRLALRATLDVDNDSGERDITFYTAPTIGGPWEQLGDVVTQSGTTSIFSGTADAAVGPQNNGTLGPNAAAYHAAEIRDGINGTVVADPDFRAQTPGASSFDDNAGRTWTLQGGTELVDVGDPVLAEFLSTWGVLVMPTMNPDRLSQARANANGVDLNRQHIALPVNAPETRALATVLQTARPLVVSDHHETNPGQTSGHVVAFAAANNVNIDAMILQRSQILVDALKARTIDGGWTAGDFPTTGRAGLMSSSAGLRLAAASVLTETHGFESPPPIATRTAIHYAMADEILRYTMSNTDGLVELVEQATARAIADGASGAAFDLSDTAYPGPTLSPAPLGYGVTSGQATLTAFHRQVFNIALVGGVVTMASHARGVIPFIFDADAEESTVHAERLFNLPDPDPEPDTGISLPTGVFSPVVTWYGCDLVTGSIIADLPDLTGPLSRLLGAATSASIAMPIPLSGRAAIGDLAFQATTPGRTMIVAVVNEQPCWAGIVYTRRAGTTAVMELGCATLESYLTHRRVTDHQFTQVDEATIARALLADAGTVLGVGSGIGLEIDAPPTGTRRDRTYHRTDRATVYDRMQQLMAVQNGPEWTIDLFWGDDTRTWFRKVVRVAKRIGEASATPAAVFETTAGSVFSSQGEANTRYSFDEDFSSERGANYIVAYSSGEGDDQPASAPAISHAHLNAGWPIYERHWQPSSSITSIGLLNAYATRELDLRRNGAVTWEIQARWNVTPRLNIDWRLGDDIAWDLVGHRHPGGVKGQGRCIGWELDPSAGVVTPILLDPISDTEEQDG